ncbi:glycosyltransferase [Oceanispirochaeta crateris]|uniref:Glycosyltransferase n=1 Tax=Oceanispirochaeta crateris TaxID=2518645 RepID=A0A5C1QM87_9SPIO|nr:glycosyltransferase family 4 protein [Oceanispirochaeta crateris]QEN08438.1 glycosyltransferase [Oceanispirochaeta crateris]
MLHKKNNLFNICFISGKLGDVDGVSRETEKWISVLAGMGHGLYTVSGFYASEFTEVPYKQQLTIKDLSFSSPRQEYYENLVFPYLGENSTHLSEENLQLLQDELLEEGRKIAGVLYQFIQKNSIDMIIAENTNALPMTLLGAVAVNELVQTYKVAALFHHHDFWWERSRFCESHIEQLLNRIMPPRNISVEHVVTSSYAEHVLSSVKRVKPHIVPNCADFDHPPIKDNYNRQFREDFGFAEDDLLFVQPTRIVPRKRIEDSIRLMAQFSRKYSFLAHKIHFIITLHHSNEPDSPYLQNLISLAGSLDVHFHIITDRVYSCRTEKNGQRCYTNADVLINADLVTYLPAWEGFGNALLETIAARVPLVTTTYLIYKTDIRGSGIQPVEIRDRYDGQGNLIIDPSVLEEIYEVLTEEKIRNLRVGLSFKRAADEFGIHILKTRLASILDNYSDEIRASRRRLQISRQSYYV